MNNHISVATIDSPQFVNLQPMEINPLMSKCDVKVLYIGQNRNRSAITKQVATEMSKTLRGCPIVGYYMESKEDFGDHGDQIIIDNEGVKFNKLTKPYGFVAPDAKVWFQFFEDTDDFGNTCVREYLMTEGYLWTGQFEECQRVIESGNGQSMELDEKTLKGYWSTDNNQGIDFFIINDAIFSKLCILGDDVEPCFEGASVTAPDISSTFSKNDDFTKSLFTMMSELKFALNNNKGGISMDIANETPIVEEVVNTEETVVEAPVENFSVEDDKTVETVIAENDNTVEEFAKKDDEKEEEKEDSSDSEDKSEDAEEKTDDSEENSEEKEEEDKKKKYELLETEYNELQEKYALLEADYNALVEFKNSIEEEKKNALIDSFYMLSDEDKAEVVANKAQYSLDEIEAKLSVICVRKKVSFDLNEETVEEQPAVTFNLNSIKSAESVDVPAFVSALRDLRK